MEELKRLRVLSLPLDKTDLRLSLKYVEDWIQQDKKGNYILAVNAEKIVGLQNGSFPRQVFENANLLIPDGISVVLAVRLLYGFSLGRLPGISLMQGICKEAALNGHKIFVYGSKEETNKKAVENLKHMYPGIPIVGRSHGYLCGAEESELINRINESRANILFVALGSPKQEEWLQSNLSKLNVNVCQGIGGTLDIISGEKKRAPNVIQAVGLEWLFRLIYEPKRVRRQVALPEFILKVLGEKIRSYHRNRLF